jgi:acyl carrier protein
MSNRSYDAQAIEQTVSQLVNNTLGQKSSQIKPDTPLFSSKLNFDSFALIELVLHLEQTFDLHIPDEDLDPDIFYSIETITAYVQNRIRHKN